jgi:hypothetical protein
MLINLSVGAPAGSSPPGSNPTARGTNTNEVAVTEVHARYYEGTYRGERFGGANQAAVAVTAAFATTYTGLVLYNPPGSSVNGVLEKVGIGNTVVWPSASVIGLMVGSSSTALSGVTAITPKIKKLGTAFAPVCSLASAATLPVAPTLDTVLASIGTQATTAYNSIFGINDLGGDILIAPGGYVAIYSTVALTAAGVFSFQWEEVPV